MKTPKKILLTTDFSDCSREAFDAATTLAEKFDAEILLLYVDDDRLPPLVGEFPTQGDQLAEIVLSHRRRASAELVKLASALSGKVKVQEQMLTGTPHREIVRHAEEEGVDLIVMATHGRGFLAHALLGSTTERVLRHAPCPVLSVRAKAEAA